MITKLAGCLMVVVLFIGCTRDNPIIPTSPTIISISPAVGNANTVVKIIGTNFKINPVADTVKFSGIVAKVQLATDTMLTVVAPANGSTGAVTVTTSDGTAIGPTFTYKLVDIYISGSDNSNAVYWKNGTEVVLSSDSKGNSIFVSGNDVYVAGQDGYYSSLSNKAIYWKNGVKVQLTSTYGAAKSIVVIGNDVYLAGMDQGAAVYWKNGIEVKIGKSIYGGMATSIAVSGNDVYVAGYEYEYFSSVYGQKSVAKYWKNGVVTSLTDGKDNAFAFSVAVSGDDVYVSGSDPFKSGPIGAFAKYWKNGAEVVLPSLSWSAEAYAIIISGKDIYAAGYDGTASKYWKNSIGNSLTASFYGGAFPVIAYSIAVLGTDVYTAGCYTEYTTSNTAVYWINGQMTKLTKGNRIDIATATGIYVK